MKRKSQGGIQFKDLPRFKSIQLDKNVFRIWTLSLVTQFRSVILRQTNLRDKCKKNRDRDSVDDFDVLEGGKGGIRFTFSTQHVA